MEDAIRARDGRPSQHLRKSRVLDAMQNGCGKVRFVFQFALNLVGRMVAVNSMERSKEEKNYTKYGRERKSSRLIRFILILRVHNCLVHMHERTAAEFVLDTRIDREVER